MKKFYKLVTASPADGGYIINLDLKPVKTSTKSLLLAPDRKIADSIVQEWSSQVEYIKPDSMPVTQWLTTAQDVVSKKRSVIESVLMDYIDTDLVIYRADKEPYASRQNETWGPAINLIKDAFQVDIRVTSGLSPIFQDQKLHQALRCYISNLSDFKLSIFQSLVEEAGSILLTYIFMERGLTAHEFWNAVFIDDIVRGEIYLEEQYGAAPDQEKKRELVMQNFQAAEKILLEI